MSELSIVNALNEHGIKYRDRVFTPVTTIWGFLSQVLGLDHSCRDTVSRIIAHRASAGLKVCSPNTASYCNARARLPTAVLRCLAMRTAQQHQASLPGAWKWHGRSVFIADGSHVSMPDTPENQASYPQPVVQQPGIGFPLARVTVLLSLATGACRDLAIAPYAGKGTGETTLLRQMYDSLSRGDVVIADALFDNDFLACEMRERSIELVARVQAERVGSQTVESRSDGEIILWQRPNKPRGMTGEQYRRYPKSLFSGSAGRSRGLASTNHEPRPSCRRIGRNGSKASAIRPSNRDRQLYPRRCSVFQCGVCGRGRTCGGVRSCSIGVEDSLAQRSPWLA